MTGWFQNLLFDPTPIVWVQRFFGLGHPEIFRALTQFGTTWGVVFAVGMALWLWGRRDAYALVGILVLEVAVTLLLNQLLHVPRPSAPAIVKYEQISVGSFPSGHVFLTTVLWGLLYGRRRVPGWLFALVVVAVSAARLYLGVHYLADIYGGILLGLLVVWVYRPLWRAIEDDLEEWSYGVWAGLGLLALAGTAAGSFFGFYGSNPFKWHAAGVVVGGTIALLLEYRYVRYAPATADPGTRGLKIFLALLGLLPLALVDRVTGEDDLRLGFTMIALGALWGLLIVPAWFVRLDLARERIEDRRERAWHTAMVGMLTILGIIVAVLAYGSAVEPRLILDVEIQPAPIPGLVAEWEGRSIAVLADFQSGIWWDNTGMMRKAVERAIEARPAAVLLAGDFVYHPGANATPEVREIREILRPLAERGIPTFAVLGNHDWGLVQPVWKNATPNGEAAQAVREMLRELGIRLLHNQVAPLRITEGGAPLYIVGIGSHYAGEDEPVDALREVPDGAPRVVFMHHPDTFKEIPEYAAPLAVAGHTHGGQVRIPLLPSWSWLTFTRQDEVHADGWIDGYGAPGNRLYVNRGIGFSIVPLRINCPPELTLFVLERGEERGRQTALRWATRLRRDAFPGYVTVDQGEGTTPDGLADAGP